MGIKTNFTGFTYNGRHSSEFNLYSASDGIGYNNYLVPSMEDNTFTVNGVDGSFFVNSKFKTLSFNIKIAYDNVSENNMNDIKRWLGDKKEHKLIFDETPYKYYIAKVGQAVTFKSICFYNEGKRIYKGTGTIQFICNRGYGYSVSNNIRDLLTSSEIKIVDPNDPTITWGENYNNVSDWNGNFILPETAENNIVVTNSIASFQIPKYGDRPYYIDFSAPARIDYIYTANSNSNIVDIIGFKDSGLDINNYIIRTDSEKQITKLYRKSGNTYIYDSLYDRFINEGDYFKIDPYSNIDTFNIVFHKNKDGTNIVKDGTTITLNYKFIYV